MAVKMLGYNLESRLGVKSRSKDRWRRMQDSNFREVQRVTNLLLKIERRIVRRGSPRCTRNKRGSRLASKCLSDLSHSNTKS
jgi:hypothetical protein